MTYTYESENRKLVGCKLRRERRWTIKGQAGAEGDDEETGVGERQVEVTT